MNSVEKYSERVAMKGVGVLPKIIGALANLTADLGEYVSDPTREKDKSIAEVVADADMALHIVRAFFGISDLENMEIINEKYIREGKP